MGQNALFGAAPRRTAAHRDAPRLEPPPRQSQPHHLASGNHRGKARETARARERERVANCELKKEGCPGLCNGYLHVFKRYWKPTERQGQARRRDRGGRVRVEEGEPRAQRLYITQTLRPSETLSLYITLLLVQPIADGHLQVSRIVFRLCRQ